MEKNLKFIAVVKQLENKKFLIKYPDFEGISSVAEKEESIEKVAAGILNTKIQELKDEKIEIPVPMGIVEVQKLLQEGEFTVFVSPKSSSKPILDKENLKNTFDSIRDKSFKENAEKIYAKSEEVIKDKIGNNVKEENYNLIGTAGGVLFAISSLLPIVGANVPFFGKIRIGFFNLSELEAYRDILDMTGKIFMIRFVVLLMVMSGLFTAYSAFYKKQFYLKHAVSISIGLFVITFIYVFLQLMRIESEVRKYIGLSYAWFGLFIAVVLIGISFVLMNKKNPVEEE